MDIHHPPEGFPVLDIGGDVGALVVYLAGPTATGELEARPRGEPTGRFHTGVHCRDLSGTAVHVAVYPEVVEGVYELLDDRRTPFVSVWVRGGEVSHVDLTQRPWGSEGGGVRRLPRMAEPPEESDRSDGEAAPEQTDPDEGLFGIDLGSFGNAPVPVPEATRDATPTTKAKQPKRSLTERLAAAAADRDRMRPPPEDDDPHSG